MLVVDDSELVTDALGVLLGATGFRMRAAHTVAEALRAAHDDAPDAMLVDITLPDGDGLEIVTTLASAGTLPRATFAMTGHDDPETEARCLAAGCHAVLVKPTRPAALLAALRERLAQ